MKSLFRQLWAREHFRAAAYLVIVLNIVFLPCIWGNRTLLAGARDAASIMPDGAWTGRHKTPRFPKTLDEGVPGYMLEPWFKLIGTQYWREGVAPLWNPHQAFGMPLAANMESQPFYPLTMLLSLHVTPRTYNLFILARLFLAGFGLYLFLGLFISFLPALGGGMAAMLAGYYVLYLSMQQTSVEVLAPAALLTGELMLRRRNFPALFWFAIVTCLVILGGMPESSFVLLLFVYAYLLFRVAADAELRFHWLKAAGVAVAATIAGFALAAILLLPFAEFLKLSFDLHQPSNLGGALIGLSSDHFDSSLGTYLLPLLNGPPNNTIYIGLRNYVGVVAMFLIIVSILAAIRDRKISDPLRSFTLFFVGAIAVTLLKRYGIEPVNSIGRLPMFRLIGFPKYEELVISISAAILAAIGLQRILKRQASAFEQAVAFWITVVLTVLAASAHSAIGIANNFGRPPMPIRTWPTILGTLVLVSLAAILSAARSEASEDDRARTVKRITTVLAMELILCFVVPVYYVYNSLPTTGSDPYEGAPYLKVLEQQSGGKDRVFLRDGVLFPDWASAFPIQDIRAVGAMYYRKYFDFLHAFFPTAAASPDGELSNRFNGAGAYQFADPLSLKLLQLTSTKYLGGIRAYTKPNRRVEDVLTQNAGHLLPGKEANISRKEFQLDGDAREGLGEHPPYLRLPYQVRVPASGPAAFHFSIALDPGMYDKGGDGVAFSIEVKDASGVIHPAFAQYVDPYHNKGDRHWNHASVDLSPYRGQTVQLLFSTDPGPKGDLAYDWATWSDFRMDGDPETRMAQPFRAIYSNEVNLYRYDDVAPRAGLYSRISIAKNGADALRQLTSPGFDVLASAVLDPSDLTQADQALISEVNRLPAARVAEAEIVDYKSQHVSIRASSARPALLVLNDSDYPGWTVSVDGSPGHWLTANFMFRGVLLPAGSHAIDFRYQPRSFTLGATISAATLLLLGTGGWLSRTRRQRHANGSSTPAVITVAETESHRSHASQDRLTQTQRHSKTLRPPV